MSSRAIQAELLQQRIAENVTAQSVDLGTWIFTHLPVRSDDQVLELCCGTGAQTLRFVQMLGESGRIVAIDTSEEALRSIDSKLPPLQRAKLQLMKADIDNLDEVLDAAHTDKFDLIFCAYGLYYSKDSTRLLDKLLGRLAGRGRIAIVGPYGSNNRQLFEALSGVGVKLSEAVTESSQRFMWKAVLPWATSNFSSVKVSTMVNPVRWSTPEKVLNYWRNTTFYDSEKEAAFEARLHRHFNESGEFLNEKWVMMAEMNDAKR